ncbi:helix-turn-helix domain-containing protein [Puia dinghuensis]|uniref:Transcriptional regulator n=1 Tax=Puia dinghuensis TaxID=1792502 RepID=A0A8J2UF83_9BACT|nr:XRE family transcriptional regulator [Puia dinghuensis]GGB07449.1 transcriptional regulator [Puia dinghuensis]
MQEELLLLIGDKIKTKRTQKNITLEQLATKAGVSKGLISQIENNRTVPSLPVLFNIIHSLEEDLRTFFEDMHDSFTNNHILIIRKGQEKLFTKEPVKGFSYRRILTRSISSQAADVVLLELKKGANRKQLIRTDAYECKYILKGDIEYQVENENFTLSEGDTLFFDGRARHRLKNIGSTEALILVFYLF